MRILQFINALTWGGAQTLLVDLCRSLTAAGHSVSVAAFRDGPVGETLREEGFPVQILGEGLLDLRAFRRLRRRIANWRPHLVHSHLCRATLWARLARRERGDFRLLTSFHGFESDVFHHLERRMASLSDHLIFPSRFLAWWYGEHLRPLPAHRFTVIPPGRHWRKPHATRVLPHRCVSAPCRVCICSRASTCCCGPRNACAV